MIFKYLKQKLKKSSEKSENEDTKSLIEKLPDKYKNSTIIGIVNAGLDDSPQNIDYAIEQCDKKDEPKYHKELLEAKRGNIDALFGMVGENSIDTSLALSAARSYFGIEGAIKVCEKAIEKGAKKDFHKKSYHEVLGDLYEENNNSSKAIHHIKLAIDFYEQNMDLIKAASIAKKIDSVDERIARLEKYANNYADNDCEKKMIEIDPGMMISGDNKDQAINMYRKAITIAEDNNLKVKSKELYKSILDVFLQKKERSGSIFGYRFPETPYMLSIAKKLGDPEEIIDMYQHEGDFETGAKKAIKLGLTERAAELYSFTTKKDKAISIALKNNHAKSTIEMFEKRDLKKYAAKLALRSGDFDKAISICENAIDSEKFLLTDYFKMAAEAAKRQGDISSVTLPKKYYETAINRFSSESRFDDCIWFAEELGDEESAKVYQRLSRMQKNKKKKVDRRIRKKSAK